MAPVASAVQASGSMFSTTEWNIASRAASWSRASSRSWRSASRLRSVLRRVSISQLKSKA